MAFASYARKKAIYAKPIAIFFICAIIESVSRESLIPPQKKADKIFLILSALPLPISLVFRFDRAGVSIPCGDVKIRNFLLKQTRRIGT